MKDFRRFMNTLGTLWEQRGTLPISSLFYLLFLCLSGFESPAAHDHSDRFQYVFTEAGYIFALIYKAFCTLLSSFSEILYITHLLLRGLHGVACGFCSPVQPRISAFFQQAYCGRIHSSDMSYAHLHAPQLSGLY